METSGPLYRKGRPCAACYEAGAGRAKDFVSPPKIPPCDKKLPKSSRCESLGLECVEEQEKPKLSAAERARVRKEASAKGNETQRRNRQTRRNAVVIEDDCFEAVVAGLQRDSNSTCKFRFSSARSTCSRGSRCAKPFAQNVRAASRSSRDFSQTSKKLPLTHCHFCDSQSPVHVVAVFESMHRVLARRGEVRRRP